MTSKSPGPQKCRLILNQTLAIQLSRPGNVPDDFWMYDSGYMIFQNFLAANSQCWWNPSLIAATRSLRYVGHIAPGMLLVTAEPCALEILRNAYSRSVLKPPSTYGITFVGDIEDCIVMPTVQGQFTPLPEALCDVIMDLTAQGHSATIENMRTKLAHRFSHMRAPSAEMIYDTLAQLNQERKIYQTAKGYFIVTPETRRSRSRPKESHSLDGSFLEDQHPKEARTMLLSNAEALHNMYGEISTERDGDLTHQCIQTNLADVICGGNPNDKIMYARSTKRRSSSFPNRSLERRHSLRIFGSSKRLQRCISTRSLSKNYSVAPSPDSSSSEYQSLENSPSATVASPAEPQQQQQRPSLLSRLFRRSGRQKTRQIDSYSAQFPPPEWFNSRTVHLHNVGTQTNDQEMSMSAAIMPNSDGDGSEISQQSSTLPRRHRRHISSESTFMIWSRDCSPIRRHSPHYSSGSLPRSIHSGHSKSKMRLQSRSPAEESARAQQRHRLLDEKINQEREKHFRSIQQQQSGPSSLESGKTSVMSGPSSIDSGKNSSSRTTSCMSSLDSNGTPSIRSSTRRSGGGASVNGNGANSATNAASVSGLEQYLPSIIASSMSNNSITLQVTTTTSGGNNANQISTSANTNGGSGGVRMHSVDSAGGANRNVHQPSLPVTGPGVESNSSASLSSSSTGSGRSSNCSNSTKIYVQNSPARSVIKLENGKLAMDNANVLIINKNETIAGNSHKEVIQFNSMQNHNLQQPGTSKQQQQHQQLLPLETQFDHMNGDCYVVYTDTGNGQVNPNMAAASGDRGEVRVNCSSSSQRREAPAMINNKLNNLTLNDHHHQAGLESDYQQRSNNHRKLSLQSSPSSGTLLSSPTSNLSYKNLLRQHSTDSAQNQHTASGHKINLLGGGVGSETTSDFYYAPLEAGSLNINNKQSCGSVAAVSGSVGCLGADPVTISSHHATALCGNSEPVKQLNTGKSFSQNKLCDGAAFNDSCSLSASNNYLSKLKSINSIDSLATIYQKSNSLMTVGSEPNLMELKVGGEKLNNKNDKLNNMIPRKETNLTKSELDPAITGSEDMYDFPSLTDLSFNSLAALKILQELNSEKVKPTTMCP